MGNVFIFKMLMRPIKEMHRRVKVHLFSDSVTDSTTGLQLAGTRSLINNIKVSVDGYCVHHWMVCKTFKGIVRLVVTFTAFFQFTQTNKVAWSSHHMHGQKYLT